MSKVTIPGLVAENISQSLADKLKNYIGGGVWLDKSVTYWVSNQGNDKTADGSQEKPFATLSGALRYIQRKVFNPDYSVSIDFLTDYEEAPTIYHNFERPVGGVDNSLFIIQNTLNHNVTISRCIVRGSGALRIKNIAITTQDAPAVTVDLNGQVSLSGTVTLTRTGLSQPVIQVAHGGCITIISGAVLNFYSSGDNAAITLDTNARFQHRNVSSVGFTVNLKSNFETVFRALNGSEFHHMWKVNINADEDVGITHKVDLNNSSIIYTRNRGYDFIPGADVKIDETSRFL